MELVKFIFQDLKHFIGAMIILSIMVSPFIAISQAIGSKRGES